MSDTEKSSPRKNGNGRGVGHFLERNSQNILMICGMLVAGASAYTALEGRVNSLEVSQISKEEFAVTEDRLQQVESDVANSVKEADIAVLKEQVRDMLIEQNTLYAKSEGALAHSIEVQKELSRDIAEVKSNLSKLTGEVHTSHKKNGH